MSYQKILFDQYHETRSALLDPVDEEKLAWFRFYFEKMYAESLAGITKNASILELGCNKGFLLRVLQENGYRQLAGVDLCEGDLEIASRIAPDCLLVKQDMFDFLASNKDKFDLIVLKAVIEHVKKEKILDLLDLIYSSLKKNGTVLIDVQNSDWLFGLHDRYVDFTHEVGFTKESLRQVLMIKFRSVSVHAKQSPFWRMSRKDTLKHRIAKKIFTSLVRWADPEAPLCLERLLIATAQK